MRQKMVCFFIALFITAVWYIGWWNFLWQSPLLTGAVQPAYATTDTFTTATTANWTAPTGVTSITVEAWGGGGAGGQRTTTGGGGGGGGGAYAKKVGITVVPGTQYSYTVGAAGTTGNPGVHGGNSSFTTLVIAAGGKTVAQNTTTGGAGGLATASTGDTKFNGGNGFTTTTNGGGGGGSGGTAANGNNATSDVAATAVTGGGPGGAGRSSGNNSGSAPVSGPGGGGGGARSGNNSTQTGGAGFAGKIAITYNSPPTFSVTPTDSPDPVTQGSNVTFAATATDAESNNWYLAVCKTNAITATAGGAPTCATSQTYCVSASTASGSSANCTWASSGTGAQNWYAFACDGDSANPRCSAVNTTNSPVTVTAPAVVTAATTGTQVTSLETGSTGNYLGGAFTFVSDGTTTNITSIKISETGTVAANTNLANAKLFYETAGTCTYNGTETQFGTAQSFDSSQQATFTGTMSITTSQVCVYVVLDVGAGASAGNTIEMEITNPSTQVVVSSGSVTPSSAVAISGTTTATSPSAIWYNSSWLYRKKITIDHTKVSGTADLTDFPVAISFTDTSLRDNALSSGNDILFTSSDRTTKIAHEIEKYTSATGALVAWVRVPTLSHTTDTDIYMYYGNSTATNQQNVTGTWTSDYKIVQHLQAGTTGNTDFRDSTGVNNSSTVVLTGAGSNAAATGLLDGAVQFDGIDDQIVVGQNTSLTPTSGLTFSTWVKMNNLPSAHAYYILSKSHATAPGESYDMQCGFDGTAGYTTCLIDVINSGSTKAVAGTYTPLFSAGTWYYLVGTWDGTTVKLYFNGSNSSAFTYNDVLSGTLFQSTANFYIGGVDSTVALDGLQDEIRVSSVAKSADWIATEYNNQSSPSTFYSVAAQETNSPVVSVSVADGIITYGFIAPSGSKSTLTGSLNDLQTATNDSAATENLNIKGSNTACPWTLASTIGSNQYVHEFSTNSGSSWTPLTTSYQTLGTSIAASGTRTFDLRVTLPSSSSCTTQQNVDVTVQAVAP